MCASARMLDFFRHKGLTSVIYGVMILAMVLVFLVGFGPTAGKKLGSVQTSCAARVKGTCIEPKAHKAAYRLIFSRGTGGMKQSTASRIVLEGLIERELLADEAGRLGITVSEEEVNDTIYKGNILVSLPADNPNLQRQVGFFDGKAHVDVFKNKDTKMFDMKTYERNVKQMTGRSPAEFREWQTRELLASKMRDLVRTPVRVADDEAFDRFVTERTTATVSYAVVRKSWVEKYAVPSDPKDVETWAKDKKNLASVKTNVRHILIKYKERGGPDPSPEKKAETKKKAEDIYERIKKGEDFGKLAKEFSDDPGSKDKGGEYEASLVPQFAEEFQKAYDSLAPGEVTNGPIEIPAFGWHIIKKNEASKDDLAKAYKGTKSADVSKKIAEKITADMKAGKSLEDACKAAIAEFGKYAPPKPAEKNDAAKDGGASATAAGDGGSAEAAAPPPSFTADTDPEKPAPLTSSAFNRGGDPIPAISGEAAEKIVKFAFEAKPNEVTPEAVATDDGLIVVQLKDRKPATKEDFEKERDTYVLGLLAAKQNEALAYYVRRLRESSKEDVKIDESNVFGAKSDAGPSKDEDDE
jgi:peptidyl-prolyl cis-trans isomerase D